MADVYQFSQSSLGLLERCIGAASQKGTKWIELFKNRLQEVSVNQDAASISGASTIVLLTQSDNEMDFQEQTEQLSQQTEKEQIERIAAILEAEPSNKVQYLVEHCENEHFLPTLAEKLTATSIERICEDLLDRRNFNENIFNNFVPIYIKKVPSSMALSFLLKAYEIHETAVQTLILTLFNEINISNQLLQEFFIAVGKPGCSQFLSDLSSNELPTDVFIHRISILTQIYKTSEKSNVNQNFLLNELIKSSLFCRENKSYGRCLLTFFQCLQNNDEVSRHSLKQLLNTHETTFKKLCQSILSNLNEVKD